MKTLTRKQVIDALIDEDIRWIKSNDSTWNELHEYIKKLNGYDKFTNTDLCRDYSETYAEDVIIISNKL